MPFKTHNWTSCIVLVAALALPSGAQTVLPAPPPMPPPPQTAGPRRVTLSEARALAIRNHPRLAAANYTAQALQQVVTEVRSALYPTISAAATAVGALANSRITAGLLNNPSIYSRAAGGVSASQLLTDFGRTGNLTASSRLEALAEQQGAQFTRAGILLNVDRAFYGLLRAHAVLQVAQETVKVRQTVLDQIQTLFNNKLRSSLDVSFASVSVSEAQLLLISAQNDDQSASAALSTALGFRDLQELDPVLEDMPAALGDNPQPFLDGSLHDRPDLTGLRLRRDSANKFAEAEKDLSRPTVSALGVAGASPAHAEQITSRYAAAGVNVSIPIFNGGLFKARHDEATLRAQALDESVRALEDQVTRDVRVAWLDARTGLQRMQTSAELQKQAALSLDLAQARYDLGLSTIVELNQSLLNKTSADLAVASARFDYQLERTVLDFQTGSLR